MKLPRMCLKLRVASSHLFRFCGRHSQSQPFVARRTMSDMIFLILYIH